jgi:3-oxoacyl-[acyl-carrier protein] reductase
MSPVLIVSGGSQGIGQSIVKTMLQEKDFRVATFSRTKNDFIKSMELKYKSRFFYSQADLLDRRQMKEFVERVTRRFKAVDILINNAGAAEDGLLAISSEESIDRQIDLNLKGMIFLTRIAVRLMLPKRGGKIINISSIVARRGYSGLSVYSAAKAGIEGFTRSLAREVGPRGITVNSVAPGYLKTEMTHGLSKEQLSQISRRTPLGRLGEPSDIIPLIRFLCSRGSDFITGQTLVIDGGLTV